MKYIKLGLPVFVVIASIVCLIMAYMENNHLGMMGYTTALFGWLALAHSEYVDYRISKIL